MNQHCECILNTNLVDETFVCYSSSSAFSDINGDGENKLVIADLGTGSYNMKLKVYKGTSIMSENTIIELPTGVSTFFMDTNEPRVPGKCNLHLIS